jgi:hypothetical protein
VRRLASLSCMRSGWRIAIAFARRILLWRFISRCAASFSILLERDMGQQHRVRVKRRRRSAYLDRKKAAAKAAAPVRREPPKPKAKPKKQPAPAPAE